MSRKLQVGDWVRNGSQIGLVSAIGPGNILRLECGSSWLRYKCVKVTVRDVPQPRKVKASELWAWVHDGHYRIGEWSTEDRPDAWGVYESRNPLSDPVATGPTPLRAIINARKALRK